MRLGCCGKIEEADAIRQAGFEFLEVNVQAVLRGDEPDETWTAAAPDPAKVPLPIEAANCLVPGHRPIVGPARDVNGLREYLQRVAKRAQKLGIQRLVFGSGAARNRPEGVSPQTTHDHLVEFLQIAGDACAARQITLVIEHLNRQETNTINFLAQARALCDQVEHPAVALLADSYHFGLEKDKESSLLEFGPQLQHVHVAEVVGRVEPGAALPRADGRPFDFVHFFCLLHKINYDQRIAVEAGWSGPIATAGPACVRFLRDAWDRAGKLE